MLCPRQCGTTIVTRKSSGICVRECAECGYQWLANPINDVLQQHYARLIAKETVVYTFSLSEIAALDQLKARIKEGEGYELSQVR